MTHFGLVVAMVLSAGQDNHAVLADFLSLPASALGGWKADSETKQSSLTTTDFENGFLEGATDEAKFEAALFFTQAGVHVLGLKYVSRVSDCPTGTIHFFQLNAGTWTEVTDDIWPKFDEAAVARRVKKIVANGPEDCMSEPSIIEWSLPRIGSAVKGISAWTKQFSVLVQWNKKTGKFSVGDRSLLAK